MKKITYLFLIVLFLGNYGCSSLDSKKIIKDYFMKNLLSFYIENADSVSFYFVMNSQLPSSISNKNPEITYSKIFFKGQNEDSTNFPYEIMKSFYVTSDRNINLTFAYVQKYSINQLPTDWKNQKINFVLNTNYGKYTVEKPIEEIKFSNIFPEIQALYLLPSLKINNGEYNFQLLAIRLNPAQGSYLPTSEKLRIEIQNDKLLYKSNEGKNYMQMISEVLPISIGDYYLYQENVIPSKAKIDLNGARTAKLIIPAMPINYISTINFWGN